MRLGIKIGELKNFKQNVYESITSLQQTKSLDKEKIFYIFDWTYISGPAKRSENYVTVELKSLIEIWNDGGHDFEMYYQRNREGKESDFLIVKDKKLR